MPVTTSASLGAKLLARFLTSEGMLGFAGCAMACASGSFALYMTMQGPSGGGSHDFPLFAQMTPRAHAERATHGDPAPGRAAPTPGPAASPVPVSVTSEEIDPIVTGSIATRGQASEPEATVKPILTNIVLRQIDGESALVEMQDSLMVYKIGEIIPGAGRLMAMTRQGGHIALQTSKGVIVEGR